VGSDFLGSIKSFKKEPQRPRKEEQKGGLGIARELRRVQLKREDSMRRRRRRRGGEGQVQKKKRRGKCPKEGSGQKRTRREYPNNFLREKAICILSIEKTGEKLTP